VSAIATISTPRTTPSGGRPLRFGPAVHVPAPVASAVSIDDICDLLDAAGPLTVRDIAGGLNVTIRQASACVQRMVLSHCLRRDEFRRYRRGETCA
jgi:hypothetical protein